MTPKIISPKPRVSYKIRVKNTAHNKVPLDAVIDAGSKSLFWFADSEFIGKVKSGEKLFWQPRPGVYTLSAVDDHGRAGKRRVRVELEK